MPQLLATACGATAGCHTSTEKEQGLDLQSPDPGSRLLGVSSTEGPGLLIDPSNPSNSVLYTKLTAKPAAGVRMPFGRPALDDATISCVLDWVTSVARGGGASGTATPTTTDSGTSGDSEPDASADDAPAD